MCEVTAKETCSGEDKIEWPPYIQKKGALEKSGYGCKKGKINSNITANDAVKWFYEVLTALDAKASALMRLNGVLIAAAAFLLGIFGRTGTTILSTTALDSVSIICSALLSAISIGLCLFVVNVSWDFLGKVTINGNDFDFHEEIKSLENVVNRRQFLYRSAWWISLLSRPVNSA
ncbi:MAG: hypothetical protein WCE58_14195 [Gallionella sp.]